jgi:polar amino acid transport system substrate-binding protein
MKTSIAFTSALAISASLATTVNAFADEITLMADSWCPYNCEPNSAEPGVFIEVATQALQAKGHKVKYSLLPWSRALSDARNGKITGVVGAGLLDAEGLELAEPMGSSSNCFFVPKSSKWTFTDAKSLESITLAAIAGYTYTEEIDAYIANPKNAKKIDVIGGDDALEKNIKKVAAGRVDAFLEDSNVVNYNLAKMKLADKVQKAGCAKSLPISVAFSKKNPKAKEFVKIVNDHLASMKKNGSYETLKKKYRME